MKCSLASVSVLRGGLLIALLGWCGLTQAATAGDYLTPDLRARVEALKADAAIAPTDRNNAEERVRLMWQWVNAFALAGRYVPVNLTAMLRPVSEEPINRRYAAALDGYIQELSLADDDPAALGELTADLGPFTARSRVTLQQVFTVGTRPILRGGGLAVARHFMADYGAFQTTDPSGPNYVHITSSRPGAAFEADTVQIEGMHGGFRGSAPALYFRLASDRLEAGDTVTVTYGGRAGGGPGLLMPTMSSDRMPFPLYVAFDDSKALFSLPIQPIRVVGSTVDGVHGFSPSVVRPGETFTMSVRAQDAYYNRAMGPIPAWQVLANGELIAEVPAGSESIRLIPALSFSDPGVKYIRIRSSDGSIEGDSNPILVSQDAQRVFWGDTHGHSGFAEGIGTPDRFMTWARDDARLDFVTHSEHDIWMDDFEWNVLRENVARYTDPGSFVAFLGYEWTTRNIFGGHHNVLFRTPAERQRVPTQFFPVLSDLYAGLRAGNDPEDVIVIPHAHQSGDYRESDPRLEQLVEIMSQHGSFEWFGRMYLSHGHEVGFIAGSDNHLSQPGYTAPKGGILSQRGGLSAVLADQVTVDGLFDAMKSLKAYATTGERIILDISLNGTGMGQRLPFARERRIEGSVIGTAPIAEIAVVRNDEVIWQQDYLTEQDGRFTEEETFHVSFSSQSIPMHRGDNPRGWRPWKGRLTVQGATLVDARPTDFTSSERTFQMDTESGTIAFATSSRGDASSIRLKLRGVSRRTRIELDIEDAWEFGSGPPIFRRPAVLPGSAFTLSMGDLERGIVTHKLPFDIYEDTVKLRRVIPQGDRELHFVVEDTGELQGDYYFVRVTQADDAMAWSSPIWVGGYPKR